ncbi:MAG: threonine synthase, partial [Chloroflexi bacterium]|nr:threonine synthase [Chloroflexota bacterium]
FVTGAGLKTQEAVAQRLPPPLSVQPTMGSFEEALSERMGALPASRRG